MRDDLPRMATPAPLNLELATRFRAARRLAEVSAIEAAAQLGISRATLHRIEKGESPLKAPYVRWAISEWKAPSWLLPGDAVVQGDLADVDRAFADSTQHDLDQDEREHPGEQDADEGTR
jgi:transcriptional regulator with XRE-family HTH domain